LQFDIWLWEKLKSNAILNQCFYGWFNLVKLCIVMALGNLQDKHTSSNLAFVKSKIQDCLTIHLDLVVWMYVQNFYFHWNLSHYTLLFVSERKASCNMVSMFNSTIQLHE
jgi:hypothetical protein